MLCDTSAASQIHLYMFQLKYDNVNNPLNNLTNVGNILRHHKEEVEVIFVNEVFKAV